MPALPNDILLLVGDFLQDHRDRYNLIFVCHRFHALFLHLVYCEASLKTCNHVQSFIRPVLKQPELARAVRALHFDRWEDRSLAGHVHITEEDRLLFNQWVKEVSQSDEECTIWEQDLRNGISEAWIALVLPLASNLRQLRLIFPKYNNYLDRTLQRAANGEHSAFRWLQEVSLDHLEDDVDDTKGNYLPSQILPFFRLPLMRSISADTVMDTNSAHEAHGAPSSEPLSGLRTSSISEISLSSSNGAKGMESLIASCSSLKSFKYQHSDSHLHSEGYRPSAFFRSLSDSKYTLQTLWLDTCGEHLPFTITGLNETHNEWFGSLADFTALKDMRIRLPNLLDVQYQPEPSTPLPDVLPQSLESLYIEGCKESSLCMLLSQVQMLLGNQRFPALKRVDIEGFFHDEEDFEDSGHEAGYGTGEIVIKPLVYDVVEPVRAVCAEAGIDLFLRDRMCLETMKGSPV